MLFAGNAAFRQAATVCADDCIDIVESISGDYPRICFPVNFINHTPVFRGLDHIIIKSVIDGAFEEFSSE